MSLKLGTHNSWSYSKPKKWWMKLLNFTSKCQSLNIQDQYENYDVKLFDLRVRFDDNNKPVICHSFIEYEVTEEKLYNDLSYLNNKKDVTIRLLLELRGTNKKYYDKQRNAFVYFVLDLMNRYENLSFILGRDLPEWKKIIINIPDGKVIEDYSSVSPPKYIDDWLPKLYAKCNDKKIMEKYYYNTPDIYKEYDFLLIDFVEYTK